MSITECTAQKNHTKNNDGEIVIKEIKTHSELKKFIAFQNELYKDCEYYVPCLQFDELDSLSPDKNPAYKYCEAKFFMAYRNGKAVGRICGLLNREYNRCWNRKCVRFTRFDFIDDLEVSRALIGAVEAWAKELNMEEIQGPMGFCDLDKEGMLVDGFEEQGLFFTIYNFPYYVKHMEALKYEKSVDWVEFKINMPEKLDERVSRIAEQALIKNNLHVLKLKRTKEIVPYAGKIFDLIYEAYKPLYGVIPLNDEQVKLYMGQFISMVRPDFLSVIVDDSDDVVAFGVVVPSMSEAAKKSGGKLFPLGFIHLLKALWAKKCDELDFLLVAVKPSYQGKGINAKLICEMFKGAQKFNVKYCETGPMLESNDKIHLMWKRFDYVQHKRRRCYIKTI